MVSQHLKLRDVSVYIPRGHLKLIELIVGLLLLCIVHKGLAEVCFENQLGFSTMEIVGVLFDFIQPVVVALDPSSNIGASNETHEVGALLEEVSGDGRVMIHNHELFESGEKVESLASIAIEVF